MKYSELGKRSVSDIALLTPKELRELRREADTALAEAKLKRQSIDAALVQKYTEKNALLREMLGKETGVINFQDEGLQVVADQPKKIEWDQDKLSDIAQTIRDQGEDPTEFLDITYKVPERSYNAWSDELRQTFDPARTLVLGKPAYKFGETS